MTDKPIIFGAPMVQALLDGRKTQTRRIIKLSGRKPEFCGGRGDLHDPTCWGWEDADHGDWITLEKDDGQRLGWRNLKASYAPGDRLWVKENLRRAPDVWTYGADGAEVGWPARRELASRTKDYLASRFMLKVASRLTLIVTDVRVQRVAEISEDDAVAEGMWWDGAEYMSDFRNATERFANTWNSIHGPDAWERNDWVYARTFTVHKCNIERMP